MNHKTEITFHGDLGEKIGKKWNLFVNSVSEAIRAIEVLSKHKLYPYLLEKDKENIHYRVLINGKDFKYTEKLDLNKPESIKNNELAANFKEGALKTIDIIPVIELADDLGGIFSLILGIFLIAVGVIFGQAYLIPAGIGLLAAGVISFLTRPPKFDEFREFEKSKNSYLFNGPYNTVEEGGPVPVGYGELIVGSQVISSSYDVSYFLSLDQNSDTIEELHFAGEVDPYFKFLLYSNNIQIPTFADVGSGKIYLSDFY